MDSINWILSTTFPQPDRHSLNQIVSQPPHLYSISASKSVVHCSTGCMKVIGLLDVYRFQFESFNSSSFFFLFCTSRRLMRFRFSRKRPQNVCILSTIDSLSAICNSRLIDSPDGEYHFEEDQTRRKSNEKRIKREENRTGGFYT